MLDPFEVGVFVGVQAVLEERLDLAGGKLRRWQADVVNHQQGDNLTFGAGIEIRRRAMGDTGEPACSAVQLHRRS
ncbi:hypothetical protein D3C79_941520 [compost metagenome]